MDERSERVSYHRAALQKEIEKVDSLLTNVPIETKSLYELMECLHVYQAELEMQNNELDARNNENDALRQHFTSLFQSIPLPVLGVDSQLNIVESNDAAKEFLISKKTVGSYSLFRLLSHDAINVINHAIEQAAASMRVTECQIALTIHDEEALFKVFVTEVEGIENQFPIFLLVLQNITIETKFYKQNALFNSLLESSADSFIALDLMGNVIQYSQNILKQFEIPPYQVVDGSNLLSHLTYPIADKIQHYSKCNAIQREYVEQTFEIDSDAEQDTRWLKVSIFPVTERNEVIGTGVIISNVTEHIRKEQDLSLAIRVFNEGHQAIMITDASQKITQVNQAFEEITGYEILEVIGKTPAILRSGKHDHEFYKRLWLQLNNEGYWEGEIINKRKNGEVYVQWISISAYPKFATRPTNYIAVFNDISEKKAQQDEINKLAFYDTLTGCGNRRCLEKDIVKVLTATSPTPFCVIFIDLDYFKLVNDVHGHDIGDKLLTVVAHRFENIIRQEDRVYRLGGDEFVIILKNAPLERVGIICQKLIQSASTPFFIEQNKIFISASLGIASYPQDGGDFLTLIKHADTALYEAKEGGRNQFKFFEPCILESVERKMSLEKGLHEAFDKNELILFVQPQLGFTNKELVRAEVLLRWQSTEFGNVSPIEIIPVAERTGLIHKITQFVLSRTIELLKEFEKENLHLSMNMSALDVKDLEFFENIKMALQQENCPVERLTIELTESVFIDDLELVESHLTELSQLGVKISIDDFGTGYSSLGYLQQLPISEIKIDKKFTYNVDSKVKNQHICKAINSLAHSFDFACVAEGVETQAQYDWLKSIDCDFSQGYLHAKPMSVEEFRLFIEKR